MPRLRCILVDDEPLALELLESLLEPLDRVEVVDRCRNGREALKSIRRHEPELVFLDVQMPGLDGFGVVKRLQPEIMPLIIFTTAYQRYALDAFDVHAVDYVLKPLSAERLQVAVERALMRLNSLPYRRDANKPRLMGAIEDIARGAGAARRPADDGPPAPDPATRRLAIRDSGVTHLVAPADIDWIDAAGDYMCIHVGDETIVSRITMKKLEEQLDPRRFVRIHRSTIVNVDRIESLEPLPKGEYALHLRQGATLKVSRSYREQLDEALGR